MRPVLALCALAAACGGGAPRATTTASAPAPVTGVAAVGDGESLAFTAGDGAIIEGTYWAPRDASATGCAIFVHQLSSTRAEWQPVIDGLRGAAHLYAIDMRGHGTSTKGASGALSWHTFETADWEQVPDDVLRAIDAITAKGASGSCVLVGASIGSTAVLLAAARAPEHTRGVVLLSPGLAYKGIKTPDAARALRAPVLLVHSQEKGAADAAAALVGIWRDAGVPFDFEVTADPGTAHGMKIVAPEPVILARVISFIGDHVGS